MCSFVCNPHDAHKYFMWFIAGSSLALCQIDLNTSIAVAAERSRLIVFMSALQRVQTMFAMHLAVIQPDSDTIEPLFDSSKSSRTTGVASCKSSRSSFKEFDDKNAFNSGLLVASLGISLLLGRW